MKKVKKILTISTHLGYIRPKRLMYGVACAPGIFQKMMDSILQGLDGVICYIDDVLIGACDRPQALLKLNEVLKRFQDHNLRVNLHKCIFLKESVEYLGFRISGLGVFPIDKRVEPILQAPPPRDLKSLRSYIAMLNFYRRFLKNLSDVIKPLTRLLQQGVPWEWSEDCQRSFDTSKKMLLDSDFLVHYDPDKPLVLVCDASKVGVGAYIAHRIDGKEYPIYFASATLNDAQRRYSQVEREAFAINFGLTKFRQYLLGKEFYLVTDNYPLKAILSPSRPVSLLISNRLHNYAMTASCYKFIPEYQNTSLMGAADLLSRLPLDEKILEEYSVKFVNLDTSEFAVTYETVAQETTKDQTLSKVLEYSSTGWPGRVREVADPLLRPFFQLRASLSVLHGCVMYGDRVVIPLALQKRILESLHEGHPGQTRMYLRAQPLFFWPNLVAEINHFVKDCESCALVNFKALSNQTVAWPSTAAPWKRIHLDFFFFKNVIYLILVDSYSRWIEVWPVQNTSADLVIDKLRSVIATFGLFDQVVTDNGPPFDSFDFLQFCTKNNIIVTKSPPYHPQSNGSVERAGQTAKQGLKKLCLSTTDVPMRDRLYNFLFQYRNTPCTVTGESPAAIMFLSLIHI